MSTQREKDLFQLNKDMFEHFTSQSLEFAKRIVAFEESMEKEDGPLQKVPVTGKEVPIETKPVLDVHAQENNPTGNAKMDSLSPPAEKKKKKIPF